MACSCPGKDRCVSGHTQVRKERMSRSFCVIATIYVSSFGLSQTGFCRITSPSWFLRFPFINRPQRPRVAWFAHARMPAETRASRSEEMS